MIKDYNLICEFLLSPQTTSSGMCFCWTSTHGFGPLWIFGSKVYHEHWTAIHLKTDGLGMVEVSLWSTTGVESVRTERLADIQFNPLVGARDLIPFPPPPECGWQEWCYIHRIDFAQREGCHVIADYWWKISPTDHQGLLNREHMTNDNAVLFCWINGNSYKKHSTTHLVHHHLVSTLDRLTQKKHSRRRREEIMQEDLNSLRSADHHYMIKHRCAGCINQCYGKLFRLCKGCKQVRYCSEACQQRHWTESHRSECELLRSLS